jgi:Pectate lyase superfamily protein
MNPRVDFLAVRLLRLLFFAFVCLRPVIDVALAQPAARSIDVRDYGAKGDGTSDDTEPLKAALSAATGKTLVLPPGTYLHTSSLSVGSSTTITGYGAILKAAAGASGDVMGLSLSGVSKINLLGLTYDGNRANRVAGKSVSAFGIYIANSSDIILHDIKVLNSLWDGIEVAYTNPGDPRTRSSRVLFRGVRVENATRNGLSIDGVVDFTAIRSFFNNTTGSAPQDGIDVEADNATIFNENTWFIECEARGNAGNGITFAQFNKNGGVFRGQYSNNGAYGLAINTAGVPDNVAVVAWYPEMRGNGKSAVSRLTPNGTIFYLDPTTGARRLHAGVVGNIWDIARSATDPSSALLGRDRDGNFVVGEAIGSGLNSVASAIGGVLTYFTLAGPGAERIMVKPEGLPSAAELRDQPTKMAADLALMEKLTSPGLRWNPITPTSDNSVSVDPTRGSIFVVTPGKRGLTIASAGKGVAGQVITIIIRNSSGRAVGAITMDTSFRLAGGVRTFAAPQSGAARAIAFVYDGSAWVEISTTQTEHG